MKTIYPGTFAEWMALAGIFVPLIIWSISGIFRALAYRSEQKRIAWQRFQELTIVLYNNNFEYGGYAQLAAICELQYLPVERSAKRKLAEAARNFWANKKDVSHRTRLVSELDALIVRLDRFPTRLG